MELTLPDLRTGYVWVCDTVARTGSYANSRDLPTRELTGVTLVVEHPADAVMLPVGVNRRVNVNLAAVEALCLIGGVWHHELVRAAAPNYGDVLVAGDDAVAATAVAYGPRTRTQLEAVIRQLQTDRGTRQAVLSIWHPEDLWRGGDKPCTVALQFLLRRSLELHVFMRSQDVWLGLAMDGWVFSSLQHTVAGMLDVEVGKYVHHVGSLHVYQRDLDAVHQLALPTTDAPALPQGVRAVYRPAAVARTILRGECQEPVGNEWWVDHVNQVRARLEEAERV